MNKEQKLKVLESKLKKAGVRTEDITPNAVTLLTVCETAGKDVNDIEIIMK